MTTFSREPPHRNLVLHLRLDSGTVADGSPHDLGVSATENPSQDMGFVGTGLHLDGSSQYLTVSDHDLLSTLYYTAFGAFRLDHLPRSRVRFLSKRASAGASTVDIYVDPDGTVAAYVDDGTTSVTLSSSSGAASAGQNHSVGLRKADDRDLELYFDGDRVDVARNTGLGDTSTTTDLYVGRNYSTNDDHFPGVVDEIRWYQTGLDRSFVEDLHEIGTAHGSTDELAESWDNPGIPFRRGKSNALFAATLAEPIDSVLRDLDAMYDAAYINQAAGNWLGDIHGSLVGLRRRSGEGDDEYRARIKAEIAAARSSGTIPDLLDVAASIVETDVERIELDVRDSVTEQGVAKVYVKTADVSQSNLTVSQIQTYLDQAVFAGHRVDVVEVGVNPFTVIADGQTNDPDLGLTSDSISTGGGLVSDA